jgi:lysozyme family protein
MASFDDAIDATIAKEGGAKITRDPTDRGGTTKYGISARAYPGLDIANLTEDDAKVIYKRDYWDRVRGDNIKSQVVAESIFDTCVNMGVRTGSRLAQTAAGITPADGIIGLASVNTLNVRDQDLFTSAYTIVKIARYAHICKRNPSQKKYLLGWINRALGGMA